MNNAIRILKGVIDICHDSELDTYCIDVETASDTFSLERVSQNTWGIDTEDDTVDDNGEKNNTKFVKNDEVLSWFDGENILSIKLTRFYNHDDTVEEITIYPH